MHFASFRLMRFMKKVLGALSRFLRPNTELFAVTLRHISKVLRLQGSQKNSGRIFTIYVSENEAVCSEIETHFGRSPPPRFTEKVLYEFSQFLHAKKKVFALKFTHILEVLCL